MTGSPARRAAWLAGVVLAGAAACAACGDNLGGFDGGPPIDARLWFDADVVTCAGATDCGDAAFRPVCDTAQGICAECVNDDDCRGRPDSFGPRCDGAHGTCECQTRADCADNANGPSCDSIVHACSCLDDAECGGATTCEIVPYLGALVRTCQSQPAGTQGD